MKNLASIAAALICGVVPMFDSIDAAAQSAPQRAASAVAQTPKPPALQWTPLLTAPTLLQSDGNLRLQYVPMNLEAPTLPQTRVAIDVNNLRIDKALVMLFGKAHIDFKIDSVVSTNTKVTLRVRNVMFTTALQAILDQGDLGWSILTVQHSAASQPSFRIGRRIDLDQVNYGNNIPWGRLPNNRWNYYFAPASKESRLWSIEPNIEGSSTQVHDSLNSQVLRQYTDDTVNPTDTSRSPAPLRPILDEPTSPSGAGSDSQVTRRVPLLGDLPIIGNFFTTKVHTERSIFTCPHCHEQITLVRDRETPVCPDCGRAFQTDWKVCPFDGAKRPVTAGAWKFCPICGQPLTTAHPKQHTAP